jgi:glycosyltransferase involved in cell wall biosynthesis
LAAAEKVKEILDRNNHDWPGRSVHVVNLPTVRGKVAALNALAERARGEWVALLDCDDTWDSHKLLAQKVAADAAGSRAAAIGTLCWYFGDVISEGPNIPSGWIPQDSWRKGNPVINSSVILRREYARWEDRFGLEDYDLWIRILRGGLRIYNIAQRLTHHRIHKGSAFNGKGGQDVAGLLAWHEAAEAAEALKKTEEAEKEG